LAAAAATLAGFGSSTLLIPVALIFMDFRAAILVVAFFHLFNNVFKIKFFWRKIDFKIFLLFGLPSIIFAFAGANLISFLPIGTIKWILGFFLILFAFYTFAQPKNTLKKTRSTAFFGGSLSGFLAGLIGMGGAIRSAFLMAYNLPKEVYVASAAAIAVVIDATRIPTYIVTGTVLERTTLFFLGFLLISAYLGVRTGKALLNKIDQITFRRIVSIALLFAGIKILF
jgi:uncharacterized membrane protein YfcA